MRSSASCCCVRSRALSCSAPHQQGMNRHYYHSPSEITCLSSRKIVEIIESSQSFSSHHHIQRVVLHPFSSPLTHFPLPPLIYQTRCHARMDLLPLPLLASIACNLPISSVLHLASVSKCFEAITKHQVVWAELFEYVIGGRSGLGNGRGERERRVY